MRPVPASLVSSRIKGKPWSNEAARSIHTLVASQVCTKVAIDRPSGLPQTDPATRNTVVLPVEVL